MINNTQRRKPKLLGYKTKMSTVHLSVIMTIFWLSFVIGKSSSNSISTNGVDIGLSVPDVVVATDQHFGGGAPASVQSSTTNYLSSSSSDEDYGLEDGDFDDLLGSDQEWEMVSRKGNQFVIMPTSTSKQQDTVRPFYVNGFNTYWLMLFAADDSTKGKVSQIFQEASSVGLTVCRTWGFNDGGWRALQKSPGVYDQDIFKALDFVLSEAKKYKIRLVMSLVNNWESYGGKSQYVKWGKEFAGLTNLTSDDDFFTHPTLRTYYKDHVKTLLNRVNTFTNVTYKNDPTIFAWELMNEARCPSDPSGDTLQAWIQEMAMHVKSIDLNHLLEIGVEGFYGPSTPDRVQLNPNKVAQQVGTDFIRNHQALGIDFASVHMYADSWISPSVSNAHIKFVTSWMKSHIEDAEKKLGGMPVIFSEFGVSVRDGGYNASFRDTLISTVYKTILDSTKKGGSGAGSLLWQIFPEDTEYMNDGYAIVLSKSPATSNIISLHSTRLMLFNSRCSWRCHWVCSKKKNALPSVAVDDQ
ncbi:mannan endo-1,4-beta-mannosidase 6-like [Papaver somniferum]|uniref:mannan endo-1,4-beta-mannosidase 6-like n=1 Tax=Papaver somniferum TaxID=3469 RepID=UPI000E705368|nr:mannan endo-1,4-beta-mannosidase 6-like [Papaver somniferum]